MKLRTIATLCVVLVTLTLVDAGRKKARVSRQQLQEGENSRCRYYRKAQVSECDPKTNMRSVTFPLKKGVNCPPTQVFHQDCSQSDEAESSKGNDVKGCKYNRKAPWSECGPGVMSKEKVMTLKPGQPSSCPPVRTKTVPCRNRKNRPGGKMKKKKKGNGKGKPCKYQKGAWSECDAVTNTRTRQLTLRKGDESVCLPKKTITKKCRKPCKYKKASDWTPCNDATNEKQREMTLKKGDPTVCNATITITKPCRRTSEMKAAQTSQCRYKPMPWGECDVRTNTMTRVLKLKSGDPALCQQNKHLTRKCRKPCKFTKGDWSECNESTNLKIRTDTLLKGDPQQCETTRTISRKCGKDTKCKYEVGDWSACDETSKERTRLKKLVAGDPTKCRPEITISRPCYKPNGEANCFLGNWGDYGPCQNGVMMKHRPVIAGGVPCERKAVKAKPCS